MGSPLAPTVAILNDGSAQGLDSQCAPKEPGQGGGDGGYLSDSTPPMHTPRCRLTLRCHVALVCKHVRAGVALSDIGQSRCGDESACDRRPMLRVGQGFGQLLELEELDQSAAELRDRGLSVSLTSSTTSRSTCARESERSSAFDGGSSQQVK